MPKMKTNSGAKKRFRFTASGKVKRKKAFHSHILTKKSPKRKRNLRTATLVHPTNMTAIRELMPNG
jgi:large subunit ribosomal protein L35